MQSSRMRGKWCLRLLSLIQRQSQVQQVNSKMLPATQQMLPSCWVTAGYSTGSAHTKGKGDEVEEDLDKPFKFSTSKAANWSAEQSFGAQNSRPLWKVVPLSLALMAFVAWMFLRPETDLDRELEKSLSDRLPDLFPAPEKVSNQEEEKALEVENS